MSMRFPQDVLRFLYWIFFKPFSLHTRISQVDPTPGNSATLFISSSYRSAQSFKYLALFYILVMPWFLAIGTGFLLASLGMAVNWLRLVFTLSVALALGLTFSVDFCIAFLLPFSVAVAIWSSTSFTTTLGIFFSFMLGMAYGLSGNSAGWGMTAGLVYGILLSIVLGPLSGLSIGAAFLVGYFRMLFYAVEAPLSWILGTLAIHGDALKFWKFHPILWDELIWFPLPGLDKHLLAIKRQDGPIAQAVIQKVQESVRQSWAAKRVLR